MGMNVTTAQASRYVDLWKPGLSRLRQLYPTDTARLFPGLIAFAGLQLSLWPMWLQSCKDNGRTFAEENRDYNLEDSRIHSYPWFAITQPLAPKATWVLVRGKNLPDSAQTYQGLSHKDVVQSMTSLDEGGKMMFYGDARDYLSRWGAYKGADNPLNLPTARCEQLVRDWPNWRQAAEPLRDPLSALAQEAVGTCSDDEELRMVYLNLASEIWQLLQNTGIIQVGPFSGNSFMKIFGLKKSVEQFNGLMLLLGDHHLLWNEIQLTIDD